MTWHEKMKRWIPDGFAIVQVPKIYMFIDPISIAMRRGYLKELLFLSPLTLLFINACEHKDRSLAYSGCSQFRIMSLVYYLLTVSLQQPYRPN